MVNSTYLYNKEIAEPFFNVNYFVDKQNSFQTIEHGTILPYKPFVTGGWNWGGGGIIDSNNKFIKGSYVKSEISGYYVPTPESVCHSSQTVIYLGAFIPVWGHFLTDFIRRLWFFKSEYFKNQFKDCPLAYINWRNSTISHQHHRLLEILEIDFDKFQLITQPTQFENIILPEESFYWDNGKKFTAEYQKTIELVRNFAIKNRTPTSIKKIYYFHGRSQVGEERLAEYFKSKGYEIIQPEKLSLDEQLNLLINCESFASSTGSTSHNSLFLREGTETIFIPRSPTRFAPPYDYQNLIDQVHPLNINYVDSTMSVFCWNTSNFCYIISEQLKKFFNDKFTGYSDDDLITFLQYLSNNINNGLNLNKEAVQAYGSTFMNFIQQLKQHKDLIASYNIPFDFKTMRSLFGYQTHITNKGWGLWLSEYQISNDLNRQLAIQAIKINFPNHKVYYSVYYNDKEGWSEEVVAPEMAGTTGKNKAIFGIKIRFDEAGAKEFDILYRVHKFDGEWTDWAKNGEVIYSYGQKLNAIQIKLESKT